MEFEREPTKIPESIDSVIVTLKDGFTEEGDPYQSAAFQVRVVMSDGSTIVRRGNLVLYLTPAQRQGLLNFMADLRAQAVAQVIGE